jgi:hypothetical protein
LFFKKIKKVLIKSILFSKEVLFVIHIIKVYKHPQNIKL